MLTRTLWCQTASSRPPVFALWWHGIIRFYSLLLLGQALMFCYVFCLLEHTVGVKELGVADLVGPAQALLRMLHVKLLELNLTDGQLHPTDGNYIRPMMPKLCKTNSYKINNIFNMALHKPLPASLRHTTAARTVEARSDPDPRPQGSCA